MRAWVCVLACAIVLSGCSRTVRDVSARTPARTAVRTPPPPLTGVAETMRRQVLNAVDAGDGDVRLREWRRALASDPGNLEARLALARYYHQTGFPDIGIEHLRLAAARFPESADVAIQLARALHAAGGTSEAIRALEGFEAVHPGASWIVVSWLALLHDAAGNYPAGEARHREAVARHSDSGVLYNNLGYNLLLQRRYAEAVAPLRRALELERGSAVARGNLAVALAAQPSAALQEWETLMDRASAHNNLAAVLIERGELESARRELDIALKYNRGHPAALSNLQLVSDLDGFSASVPAAAFQSAWSKFVRTLSLVFIGPEPSQPAKQGPEAVKSQRVASIGAGN